MLKLDAGAKGYLLKDSVEAHLVPAIQAVAEGRAFFSPAVTQTLDAPTRKAAAFLGLSPTTIKTHRGNLMQKLKLHNTAEIVVHAVRKKIIWEEER